jgi:serine/threonine-protein kinase
MEGAPQVVGRYAIYGKIASGGMASVHFGRLIGGAGFSRTVAIKRLHPHLAEDPEVLSTIIDEARLAARIHHPNVVATLDVVATDRELLLVMEYVRGEALSRLVKIETARGRVMPLPITSAIALGALHGLHAAHEATSDHGEPLGIVHRDVSPQNILVGVDGLARVIDFGIAKAAGRMQMTREGTVKGKIAYMSPEQLGGAQVTRSADVYAMGVVLWEALTGRRLFQADSDAALAVQVVNGAKEPPSMYARGVPPSLDALVMRALARTPARRFATAREMAELLTRIVPPALPTDVGEWCAEAARDLLEKRGMVLAEIESSSGIVPISNSDVGSTGSNKAIPLQPKAVEPYEPPPPTVADPIVDMLTMTGRDLVEVRPSSPDLASGRVTTGSGVSAARPRVNARALLADAGDDDPGSAASRHSNLSMSAYAEEPSWWSKPQLVAALGGGILLGLVVAVALWMTGSSRVPSRVTATPASSANPAVVAAPAAAPSASASQAVRAATSSPPPTATPPATPAATWTAIPPVVSASPPPTPPPSATSVHVHGSGHRGGSMTFEPPSEPAVVPPPVVLPPPPEPVKPPPPPPPPPAVNCNPPFTIDADGKHFKPECFSH